MTDTIPGPQSVSSLSAGSSIAREIAEAASPSRAYFIMTGLAAILAAYGLLANSPAVIIGAMLVAMLLNPITGLSYALATGDGQLIARAGLAEILGAGLVFAIGIIVALTNQGLPVTEEMINRSDPGLLDLVIAVAGGTAVAYATGNSRLNSALAGVAIATSLVPPLVDSGMLLVYGQLRASSGAFILFTSNYASILFSATSVFWLLGHRAHKRETEGSALVSTMRFSQMFLFAALAAHLAYRFERQIEARTRQVQLEERINDGLGKTPGARLIETRIAPNSAPGFIVATVRTPSALTPADVATIERGLPNELRRGLHLRVRSIPVVVADSRGYYFKDSGAE